MKNLLFSALLLLAAGLLFTSCTSVPQDRPVSNVSSTSTRTYSK